MLFMLLICSDWSVCTDGILLAYPHTRELGVFAVGGLNEFGSPRVFWLANDLFFILSAACCGLLYIMNL